jgi:hypothetical protein
MRARNLVAGLLLICTLGAVALVVVRKMKTPAEDQEELSADQIRALQKQADDEHRELTLHPPVPVVTLPPMRNVPPAFTPKGRSLATGGIAQEKVDISGIIRDLQNPALHDQAIERAKVLPETAIISLSDAIADQKLPPQVRSDLNEALREIYRRATAARLAEDALAEDIWRDESGVLAYKKTAHDPKLDPFVLKALDDLIGHRDARYQSMDIAFRQGSKDPLLRFYQFDINTGARSVMHDFDALLPDMEASSYPTGRKILVNLSFLKRAYSASCPPDITFEHKMAVLDRTLAMLPAMMAEKPGRPLVNEIVFGFYGDAVELERGKKNDGEFRKRAFDRIYPVIARTLPDNAIAIRLEEECYKSWAWDARGDGFSGSVSEDGWRLFSERLAKGAEAAERGWRIDPLNADVCGEMIVICMGQGADRADMELWFTRAMEANPHNLAACLAKMDYLFPKWHGSREDVLDFGRECVEKGDAKDRLPTVLLAAHLDLSKYYGENAAYYLRPGVWNDIQLVYDKLLADPARPKTDPEGFRADRGSYLSFAYGCHQWKDFLRLADEFENNFDVYKMGGPETFSQYKQKAAAELEKEGK